MESNTPQEATPATAWKGKVAHQGQALPLPSGNTALVRQLSPTAFLTAGFMPDPLTNIVREAINKKSGLPPTAIKQLSESPEQIGQALEAFDKVLTYCVLEPVIQMPPMCIATFGSDAEQTECHQPYSDHIHMDATLRGYHTFKDNRDPNILYADEVVMDDKLFIFQWALGGTSDLQQFREERAATVDSLEPGKAVRKPTKRAAAGKRR